MKRDLKCWFYCYGPFEAPRYVTCVVVEGGVWGGTTTAPIAQEIMKRLFAMDAGNVENVAFLQPAQGNFNGATEIVAHQDAAAQAADSGVNATDTDGQSTPASDIPPINMSAPSTARPGSGTKRAH